MSYSHLVKEKQFIQEWQEYVIENLDKPAIIQIIKEAQQRSSNLKTIKSDNAKSISNH